MTYRDKGKPAGEFPARVFQFSDPDKAREAQRKGLETRRRNKESRAAEADARRTLRELTEAGLRGARAVDESIGPEDAALLARSAAIVVLSKVMAGDDEALRPKSAAEAARVADMMLKLARLEEGKVTSRSDGEHDIPTLLQKIQARNAGGRFA